MTSFYTFCGLFIRPIKGGIVLLSITLLSLVSCATTEVNYFPSAQFSPESELDNFVSRWYSGHLRSMNEKPLPQYSESQVVRFTWLANSQTPVTLRLTRSEDGHYEILGKKTDGDGGFEPGKIIDYKSAPVPTEVGDRLLNKFEKECRFWQQPTKKDQMGAGGSQWIFEGKKQARYHVVDLWQPSSGCLRELALDMLKLSELETELT
ncbi:hypothetical protein [Marinibactrum halimedae]|uniref:Uncharacterized protein n=1 Tax=Marinibactrum halimedae TaxID=1444977 RepID=A0AA37WNA1_9GAMM|nr:hypothetical protein [Marinibactrum halimedae]MCD9458678.1 hypothetical protein [Marinibactrum halimedae]GLS25956.1 hypothetical protein GCM10007877_16710 [Marinibactrum halimedae]